ncbi:single-stranded DNA-binding protein [Ligilactobacillus sp. WILCCON 0076]|uniref:Single-stranded DNA-binding protein n=1 Tax=Ligilactobacillus ubinensis TaxID=2876789 RepID=A0A9X2FK57_9LACO|nr:single-stranded DNA-binding protein [Ligilactobacillus ubinensis]MCP0887072.1 single-stranded DNA-binding protein [Ligilactobacillus ubinensis]
MINNVVLVGRLTKDPDLRFTPSGVAVANFTIAIDRRFTNQQGEREADFINCVMWRKPAENFANFTHKGSLVGIEGRIQTRNYENQQGSRVYVTEVLAENFSLLESRNQSESYRGSNQGNNTPNQGSSYPSNGNPYGDPAANNQQPTGFSNNGANNTNNAGKVADPFANDGDKIDIADDDLPF